MARHGIDLENPSGEAQATDERQYEWLVYAEIQIGRVATGPRAGWLVQRVGHRRLKEFRPSRSWVPPSA